MNDKKVSQHLLIGSLCGIIGTTSYILAIMVELPAVLAFVLVSVWPICAIIFAFSIYKFIAIDGVGPSGNRFSVGYVSRAFIDFLGFGDKGTSEIWDLVEYPNGSAGASCYSC